MGTVRCSSRTQTYFLNDLTAMVTANIIRTAPTKIGSKLDLKAPSKIDVQDFPATAAIEEIAEALKVAGGVLIRAPMPEHKI